MFAPHVEAERPNLARFIFLDPRARDYYVDWPLARSMTAAMLRLEAGRDPLNSDLTALIGELSTLSPQFCTDWADQDVHEHRSGQKVYRHPEVGEIEVTFDVFELPGETGLSICTYSVEEGSPSADKFALLASWAATQELVASDGRPRPSSGQRDDRLSVHPAEELGPSLRSRASSASAAVSPPPALPPDRGWQVSQPVTRRCDGRKHMARIFITGSADGLGRATAQTLLGDGHEVIVHARSAERLAAVKELIGRGAAAVVGDLADLDQTGAVAEQVNELGGVDAVIHNAGVLSGPSVMPVNIVAPYLLTALINRPQRLIYLSSDMHHGGRADVAGLDWRGRRATGSYSDSKLFVTTLALAVARIWPDVFSNAVDPGWVPTRMGGPGAPDDLRLGHLTQEWLATSDEPEACTTGGYWYHQRRRTPHPAARNKNFQDSLLDALARFTATPLTRSR